MLTLKSEITKSLVYQTVYDFKIQQTVQYELTKLKQQNNDQ